MYQNIYNISCRKVNDFSSQAQQTWLHCFNLSNLKQIFSHSVFFEHMPINGSLFAGYIINSQEERMNLNEPAIDPGDVLRLSDPAFVPDF
ncbi:MAG: hypothetical protein KGY42_06340, partial [Desulfobacterales bacterium]|nr:hypothetical protein [Desulfobacterales bacterium]